MANIFKRKSGKFKYVGQEGNAAWRRYQRSFKKKSAKRRTLSRLPLYLILLLVSVLILKGGFYLLGGVLAGANENERDEGDSPGIVRIERPEIRNLLESQDFVNTEDPVIRKTINNREYVFHTTLDPDLQRSVVSMLDKKWARHIAIVVMDPGTGKILAMASHDKNDPDANPCLSADFPAASLFKIVTAAAAIENCGFDPDKELPYNGGKYTLYKSQLKDTENKYTNRITFESAFAQSVNPVFGKIGKNHLGGDTLEKFAFDFGFNREIGFDLPLEPSIAPISEHSYNWAEVACGFNRKTRISPIHAAMMAASIIYNGRMMKPRLIDKVTVSNRKVYRQKPESIRPVSPQTALMLKPLMHTSLTSGTARGSFMDKSGRAILKNFEVGGKTGSINYNPEQIRYDWFTGYARRKGTSNKIAVSVLVAHEKYIGMRSPSYFRKIVEAYFHNSFQTAGAQK
ncbi:MAG: penicillin-binding transpeptidase domain-containing protein [Desulfobacterales bacterium]